MQNVNARTVATQIVTQVIKNKHSLSESLETGLSELKDSRERALAQSLCYGVLRWQLRLERVLQLLLKKPLQLKDYDIKALLLIGLYQHIYCRIPSHAATAATVEVTRHLKKTWATSLVNAVLRNFQRQQTVLLDKIDQDISARWAHPLWFLKKLQQNFPEKWTSLAQANNEHPPMSLRINALLTSRESYLALLKESNIESTYILYTKYGMTVNQPMPVDKLPHFSKGWVSVQDGAAQLAVELLDVPEGARILDACAAPGGKTAQILERNKVGLLFAIDNQKQRVEKIHETLKRLHLSAIVRHADATQPEKWWDGQFFERIILDVPCSSSGVVRRHPDIKFLRQATDIEQFVEQQAKLLDSVWQLLAPQGKLLYITCSVFAEENHLQMQNFLKKHTDAIEIPLTVDWGHAMPVGRQILTGEHNFDGFYYALCQKI